MDRAPFEERLVEIDAALATARAAGDSQREAELLVTAASCHHALDDSAHARTALVAALDLHRAADRRVLEGRVYYALGVHHERLGELDRARASFGSSIELFRDEAEHGHAGRSLMHLCRIELSQQRLDRADSRARAACEALAKVGEVDGLIEALKLRAYVLQLLMRPHDALVCLQHTLKIAGDFDRKGAALELRLALRTLVDPLGQGVLGAESLDTLIADARAADNPGLAAFAQLYRAAERHHAGDADGAVADVQVARQAALDLVLPILYLNASLLQAEIDDAKNDRLAVLKNLFTAMSTLARLLGDDVKAAVAGVIHAYRQKWGETVWQDALTLYRHDFD